jgi:hypothetical protein
VQYKQCDANSNPGAAIYRIGCEKLFGQLATRNQQIQVSDSCSQNIDRGHQASRQRPLDNLIPEPLLLTYLPAD